MADERVGLEKGKGKNDLPGWPHDRVGGAEAAPIRAETTLRANATLALGAAEPEVGACGERRVEVAHQVWAERGHHEPLAQFVLEGGQCFTAAFRPAAAVRYKAPGHELTGLAVGVVRWRRRHEGMHEGREEN